MDEPPIPKCSNDADLVSQDNSQLLSSVGINETLPQNSSTSYQPKKESKEILIKITDSNPSNNDPQPRYLKSPIIIKAADDIPITNQPLMTNLISPMLLITVNQPQSLFSLALSKLNESSRNYSVINYLNSNEKRGGYDNWKSVAITPPDSLTSAPPSYSFVLRQMAARRRPRLMGTFIPSPSFVQHTPPPTYATAFDIYIDPGLAPPPRVYNFGFTPMPVICPECGFTGMTITTSKITICTHLCAFILCLFCCWICAPLPYVLRSCKDVYHYCRNCRHYLGLYCPTNPENSIPSR